MQQQQPPGKPNVVRQSPLPNILPSNTPPANIRPASSVSTQTNHGVQTTVNSPVINLKKDYIFFFCFEDFIQNT